MPDPLQEDRGLLKLHGACIDMNAIWRPTPCHDVGVDGQIEFLEKNDRVTSTGKILAVQVKSGPSYFKHESDAHFSYYPSTKHRNYWASLNLPVILVLHNPDTDITLFTAIKDQLRDTAIKIPKHQQLTAGSRDQLLEIAVLMHDPLAVLQSLCSTTVRVSGVTLSGADFLLACLHPTSEYFEIRMARFHELFCSIRGSQALGIGQDEYEFIHRFSMLCLSFEITSNFALDFDQQWYELKMVPDIVASLTPLGQRVSECLRKSPERYLAVEAFSKTEESPHAMHDRLRKQCQNASDRIDAKDTLYAPPL
ncbi:DUF4365 domain-containing protein [Planctomycetaceae bacterium SH139]